MQFTKRRNATQLVKAAQRSGLDVGLTCAVCWVYAFYGQLASKGKQKVVGSTDTAGSGSG